MDFERSIGTRSPYPISILCCHDARRAVINESKTDYFPQLLKAHGHCLFQGIGMPTGLLAR
jgi:hypothetical protein